MRRSWVKLFCDQWLRGSIRKEPAFVRAIFVDLLAMAGDSAYGDSGIIKLAENVGFTDEIISGIICVSKKEWIEAKKRLADSDDPRIEIIDLSGSYAIKIINWDKYQSEYQRQKRYRQNYNPSYKESYKQSYNGSYKESNKVEGEGEGEGEGDIESEEDIETTNVVSALNQKNLDSELKELPEEKKLTTPKINFNFEKAEWENITDLDKKIWKEAYPACDIELELAQMKAWLLSNPEKKKKNYRRFITNWLSRSQEKGGTKNIVKLEDQDPELRHLIEGFGEHQGRMMYERMKRQREEAQNG